MPPTAQGFVFGSLGPESGSVVDNGPPGLPPSPHFWGLSRCNFLLEKLCLLASSAYSWDGHHQG